jgi:hypothetical protein
LNEHGLEKITASFYAIALQLAPVLALQQQKKKLTN